MEAAETFDKKRENKRRLNLVDYNERKSESLRNQKIKSLIDFDEEYSSSIKSLTVKKDGKINLTTKYFNGKMLMFSKVSLKSFVFDLIDVFMFPNEDTRKFYDEYQVQKCYLYQNLTDFIFISHLGCSVDQRKSRENYNF